MPHNRPHPLNARWPMLFKPWGSLILSRYFFWVKRVFGDSCGITLEQIHAHQIGHVVAYQRKVRLVHLALYRKEVHIFGLYTRTKQFAGKATHGGYLHQSSYRFALYESECLPPLAATIGIAAAQRDEYRRYAVRQGFGQQVGGSFLAYAANLQIGASP